MASKCLMASSCVFYSGSYRSRTLIHVYSHVVIEETLKEICMSRPIADEKYNKSYNFPLKAWNQELDKDLSVSI